MRILPKLHVFTLKLILTLSVLLTWAYPMAYLEATQHRRHPRIYFAYESLDVLVIGRGTVVSLVRPLPLALLRRVLAPAITLPRRCRLGHQCITCRCSLSKVSSHSTGPHSYDTNVSFLFSPDSARRELVSTRRPSFVRSESWKSVRDCESRDVAGERDVRLDD